VLLSISVWAEEPPIESWVQRYNGPVNGDDYAVDLSVDSLGNVYVTGRSQGSSTGSDYATIKYGPNGNQLWVARYNGPGNNSDGASALAIGVCPSNWFNRHSFCFLLALNPDCREGEFPCGESNVILSQSGTHRCRKTDVCYVSLSRRGALSPE